MANLVPFFISTECDIYYNPEYKIVQSRWKGIYVEGHRLKEIFNELIYALESYKCSTIIADAREMLIITQKDRQWTIDDWYPRAVKAGFRNQGLILSKDTFNELTVKQISANYDNAIITTKYFTSPSHALYWVREIGGETVGKMNNEK